MRCAASALAPHLVPNTPRGDFKMSGYSPFRCMARTVFCIAAAASILLCAGASTGFAADPIIVVGVYENPPKVFTNASGKPDGIFIDIIEYIAEAEGWEIDYRPGTWPQGLERLEKGTIDLMPDVADTLERTEAFSFHREPVLSSWFQVYAPAGHHIQSILGLDGKRVAVLADSVQEAAFERLSAGFELDTTIVSLPDYTKLFERVADGSADAAIANRFYGLMQADGYGLSNTSVIFHPTQLFFAAPSGSSQALLNTIDEHLSRIKADPRSMYYRSITRWTSVKTPFILPAWVKVVGLIAVAGLIISLGGSALLRRQVNARTRQLQEINREMEARIEERTADLAAATEKAKESDHLKSAFLAIMSHELRTPLNSIIGFTGILLQELAGPLNEEQQKQMRMVQDSSRHLLALINDVLDISKIEAGELSLSHTEFEIRPVVEKAAQVVSPMAEEKGLDLQLEIAENVSTAVTDQRRLEQILINLLNNAVKFTEKGNIRVGCRKSDGSYIISVTDTGIGIHPEKIPSLFNPFHQVDTGLSRKHEGTGLGLSICKKLIVMMGGEIDVQSQPDEGSTFTLRFPAGGEPGERKEGENL